MPAGARCMFPEQCTGAAAACVVAVDDPNVTYCTRGCDANADCPGGMVCVPIDDNGRQCRYPIPSPDALGAGCGSDADCVEGTCSPTGICAETCVPTAPTCPEDSVCEAADGSIDFYCTLPPPEMATGSSCATAPGACDEELLPCLYALAFIALCRVRRGAGDARGAYMPASRESALIR